MVSRYEKVGVLSVLIFILGKSLCCLPAFGIGAVPHSNGP